MESAAISYSHRSVSSSMRSVDWDKPYSETGSISESYYSDSMGSSPGETGANYRDGFLFSVHRRNIIWRNPFAFLFAFVLFCSAITVSIWFFL